MKEKSHCNKLTDYPPIFKLCCRAKCNELGPYKLSVLYVHKPGYFCAEHKDELEQCGLIKSD